MAPSVARSLMPSLSLELSALICKMDFRTRLHARVCSVSKARVFVSKQGWVHSLVEQHSSNICKALDSTLVVTSLKK